MNDKDTNNYFDESTMGKSKILCTVLLLILLFSGCIQTHQTDLQAEWGLVIHDKYQFSVDSPPSWRKDIYGDDGYRGVEDIKLIFAQETTWFSDEGAWIHIKQRPAVEPSFDTIESWANEIIDQEPSQLGAQLPAGFEELIFQEELLDDVLVQRRRYIYFNSPNLVTEEIFIPRPNDMIIIHLAVTNELIDEVYPDFERVVNSFKSLN